MLSLDDEEPDSSLRSYAADSAHASGNPGAAKPRLHAPWDHDVVRGSQRVERRGAGGLHAAPSPPRVSALSGAHRAQHAPSAGDSSDPRQLCHAHSSGRRSMVCGTPPLSPALHAHRRFLAELVERFFAEITDKRIRRGTFRSVGELVRAILDYIRRRNRSPKPFVWTASARSIARKVRHCNEALETGH